MFYDMDKVPWVSKQEIKAEADALLLDYEISQGIPVEIPIPVENIIENHLGFVLEYEDLQGTLGFDDVLGATWLKRKKIVVNEKLLQKNLGRMFFTCGHEIGHIILHTKYLPGTEGDSSQPYARQEIGCRETTTY